MVSEAGSFAEHTILKRKPQIIANIIATNDYPGSIVDGLESFRQEIAEAPVAPLREDAEDAPAWLEAWRAREGRYWLELDWFFAEAYFYRRVLEVVRYFQPGPWHGVDPFESQKQEALEEGLGPLAHFYRSLPLGLRWEEALPRWLSRSLWGNRVDLSNITVATPGDPEESDEQALLLIDHREAVRQVLASGIGRSDFVADNSGSELLADLGLIDMLLSHDVVDRLHLHAKGQPYFVSDAMPKDVQISRRALCLASEPALRRLGRRLEQHLTSERLVIHSHPFWTSWQHYSAFPPDLRHSLSKSDLIVLKGDANYRRLVDDRHWPTTAPLEEIAGHMPTPFVAIRTLKSEIVVGLPEGLAQDLMSQESDWMINGRRGIIHLVNSSIE